MVWHVTVEVSACGLAVLSLACPKHQDFVRSRFRSDFFYLKHCAVAELLETRPERSATQSVKHMSFGQAASVESRCAMLSAVSLVTQLETGPNSQAERYTAVVLDADVVAVVLDRGLERWLHSDFSRSARNLQVAQAKVCSNLFSSWFLGTSAFSCLQLPSVAFNCSGLRGLQFQFWGFCQVLPTPWGMYHTDLYRSVQSTDVNCNHSQVLASFSSTSVTCRGWGAWGWLVQHSPASGCLDLLKCRSLPKKSLLKLSELA